MLSNHEMQALSQQINLELFNNLLSYILETAQVSYEQRMGVSRSCLLASSGYGPGAVQQQTGFLYLGELLERYEERYGMPVMDLRAIALALAFAADYLMDNMFVGSQKDDFLKKVKAAAANDIFLTGALYMLDEDALSWEKVLWDNEYTSTEELMFALSIFPDFSEAFIHFKPQLHKLLGKRHTAPVVGNTKLLDWFAVRLIPELKQYRGKDMALFRAICALPTSFVKPDSKHYETLLENGFTSLDIAYANMMLVQSQEAPGVLDRYSIVTEKIAVQLFREVLPCEEPFSQDAYSQLRELYKRYSTFTIKCYGTNDLLTALGDSIELHNADTFIWLADMSSLDNPLFHCFDVLDSQWDKLATELPPEQYRILFCRHLSEDMDTDGIKARIAWYKGLTGTGYLDRYYEKRNTEGFSLLVEKEVIDLWQAFSASLDESGNTTKPGMLENISHYFGSAFTLKGFLFFEKFLEHYSMPDLHRFFGDSAVYCFDRVASCDYQNRISINFEWSFLNDDMRCKLLDWVQETFFLRHPAKYPAFLVELLCNETAAGLLSWGNQRAIFDLLLEQKQVPGNREAFLKERLYTIDELQAEQKAMTAAKLEQERQRELQRVQEITEEYARADNDFNEILEFLNNYHYFKNDRLIACNIVYEHLNDALSATNCSLKKDGFADFLRVCGVLTAMGVMDIMQAQEYISKIKEDVF